MVRFLRDNRHEAFIVAGSPCPRSSRHSGGTRNISWNDTPSTRLSNQPHPLEARVPLLADDDVIVHGNAERVCDRNDLLRHLGVRLRWRRIARGMIVDESDDPSIPFDAALFFILSPIGGTADWGREMAAVCHHSSE